MFWMQVLLDNTCLESGVFDVAYLTEIDPLWEDSATTFILNPDGVLFSNPVAQAACAADCVAATAGFPLDPLMWCDGCQGSMYPLNGWVSGFYGGVQGSSLIMARLAMKMHREMLMWAASGKDGQCNYYPQPVMRKSNYKYHMVYPVPQTGKIDGKCCQPFGRSTAVWGSGKEFPYQGEDFAYQIFRKRDCCAGNLLNYAGDLLSP
jgi:conjugal transfer pilus assembly protein TraU